MTRPVNVDRPALDLLVNESCDKDLRSYHLRSQYERFREAFEVTRFLLKDKVNSVVPKLVNYKSSIVIKTRYIPTSLVIKSLKTSSKSWVRV